MMKSTETAETVGQSPQKLFHSLRLGGRTRPNSRDSLRGLSSFNSSNRERHFSTVDLGFLNYLCTDFSKRHKVNLCKQQDICMIPLFNLYELESNPLNIHAVLVTGRGWGETQMKYF